VSNHVHHSCPPPPISVIELLCGMQPVLHGFHWPITYQDASSTGLDVLAKRRVTASKSRPGYLMKWIWLMSLTPAKNIVAPSANVSVVPVGVEVEVPTN
jgi:hypothetical protein